MALPYNNVKVSDLTEGQKEYVLPDNNDRENVMPMELRKFGRYLLQKMPMLKVTQRAGSITQMKRICVGILPTGTFVLILKRGLIRIGSTLDAYRTTAITVGMNTSCVAVRG